jgi:hypothetical protein
MADWKTRLETQHRYYLVPVEVREEVGEACSRHQSLADNGIFRCLKMLTCLWNSNRRLIFSRFQPGLRETQSRSTQHSEGGEGEEKRKGGGVLEPEGSLVLWWPQPYRINHNI